MASKQRAQEIRIGICVERQSILGDNDAPPPANPGGQSVSSNNLRQSHLWGRAPAAHAIRGNRGAGGGAGGGGAGGDGAASSGPRFERLSSLCLEVDLRQSAEGGGSSLFSEDTSYQRGVLGDKKKKRKKKQKTVSEPKPGDDDDDDGDDVDDADGVSVMAPSEQDGEDGVEPLHSDSDRSKRQRKNANGKRLVTANANGKDKAAAVLAAAAFGGGVAQMETSDDESDEESLFSANSELKKKAYKAAFPIRGVSCIGCAMAHRINCVEIFILDNISRMSSDALWKHASLVWKLEVVDKAKREGNIVPDWNWKDLRSHFLLHCSNPIIARQSSITQLQLMRSTIENRLVRVEDDGSRELDKSSADLFLKVLKQESAERTLLANLMSGGGGGGGAAGKGGKAAGGPTVGDAGGK